MNRLNFFGKFCALIGTICLAGCGSKSGTHKPVSGKTTVQEGGVSFSQVAPIFQARCVRCHNSGTNDWSNEQNLLRVAKSGVLAQRIGGKTMPQVGSPEAQAITQSERDRILAWARSVSQGPSAGPVQDSNTITDRNLAILTQCATCHGMNGTSVAPNIPNLAGHSSDYIVTRLNGFLKPDQTGTMPETLKSIVSQHGLGSDTLEFLANYFSNQQVEPRAAEFKAKQDAFSADQKAMFESAKQIVQQKCVACHLQSDDRPADSVPMIFGQKADYLAARFAEFKSGKGGEVMPSIVPDLTDTDIKSLVFYLSNVHPTQVQPTPP